MFCRRAEWLHILGVKSSVKRLYACSRHFSEEYVFGNRISKFAVPIKKSSEPNANIEDNNEGLVLVNSTRLGEADNLEDIVKDKDINNVNEDNTSSNFSTHSQTKSSRLKSLRAALDHYRGLYLTERRNKSKLRTANARLSREIETYKSKIVKLEFELKKKNDMTSKISNSLSLCVENSLVNHNREAKNRRYSIGLKLIALAVHFLSPLVYRYLCKIMDWPQIRTLHRFVQDWPKSPGNLSGTFEALKVRARDFTDDEKYVSVSCDEMALKTFLDYDRFKDKIIGLEDFGDQDRSRNIATSAMVIMASGIGGHSWSQAVSYFFVHGNCKGFVIKQYVFEAISKLESIGLKPCQFVCDQGPNFVNFSKVVGVTQQQPYFEVNNTRVYFMHDSPHLLKSARNCLLKLDNKIYFNNKLVSWNDVIHFFEVDSNSLKCAPKLSMEHIYPNNFQRMRVSLAAQVLSRTVSIGMRILHSSGKLSSLKSSTFLNTADYLIFYNNLFDLFNINANNALFNCSDEQLQLLSEASQMLQTFKIIDEKGSDVTNTFKFISGWLINISSLKYLWVYLNQEGFQELKTRRLTQDHLEHFFGQIRKGSGNSVRITPRNFSSSFQKRWGLHYIDVVVNGNCEAVPSDDKFLDFSIVDLAYSFDSNNSQWDNFHSLPNPCPSIRESDVCSFNVDKEERAVLENNAFVYICGYFYLKLYKMHSCDRPLPKFDGDSEISEDFNFTFEKQFDKCHLVKPPQGFVDYYRILENKFNNLFDQNCHRHGLREILFDELVK